MDANLSIFKKGLLLVSFPLLSQLALLAILAMVRADQANAQQWAFHTKEVIAKTVTAQRLAVECHSRVRGYLLTSDLNYIKEFESTRGQLSDALTGLKKVVDDSLPQIQRVVTMTDQANALLTWLDETIRLHGAGQREQVIARTTGREGQRRLDALAATMHDFLAREEQLDQDRQRQLEVATYRQNVVLILGLVFALVSSAAMVWAFSRGISGRLNTLTANVRRLGAGEELTPVLPGRDEISHLDRAFHQMADALRHKDQENDMFVYSVSHDLRTPLVNLQGFSQELATVTKNLRELLAGAELPPNLHAATLRLLDRDAAESVHYILTAVNRLAAIIDGLLRLSRAGRVEYRKQLVDVHGAVSRVVDSLRDSIKRSGAEVVIGALPPALGDPAAVEQIFANLIGNAVNYLDPQRSGKIEIGSCADGTTNGAPPGHTVYYVKDNGQGIPPSAMDKMFQAFQRLHPRAAPGEGIGLALVRRAVERHGGKVWLTSSVDEGTTMFVALPPLPAPAISTA